MLLLEKVEKLDKELGEQHSELCLEQEENQRWLDQLEQTHIHIKLIQELVLTKLAHSTNAENWLKDPLSVQACNGLAHGSQVKADLTTVESQDNLAE